MPRYALITGASSGIGLALAEALARRGRALILVARQRDALESIAYELAQRFGVEVLFRTCDLSEPLQLSGLLHELEQGERQIDLLVNNAGIGTSGPFIDQEWAREQELIELNILALARLCHSLGARMAAQGGGQILNIASVAAFQPGAWMSNYYASKAYVLHFSEGLREELK
ncbi:SDR family oxidoreductase, partial [Pseudomonas aeruginosa]|nr:SDR family oxidoreductase [Pseudomonas aeruginosa]